MRVAGLKLEWLLLGETLCKEGYATELVWWVGSSGNGEVTPLQSGCNEVVSKAHILGYIGNGQYEDGDGLRTKACYNRNEGWS